MYKRNKFSVGSVVKAVFFSLLFLAILCFEWVKDKEKKGFDPRKLLLPGFEAIKETVKQKLQLFGSDGKA
jgi:fructose/tagatose bisphosphate aldolase